MEGFPSGQREQTVNLSAQPSEVRILPPPPKNTSYKYIIYAGIAQLVEHQPSKLRVASSSLVSRSKKSKLVLQQVAHIAQLVERILGKDEVTGSNPVVGSMWTPEVI